MGNSHDLFRHSRVPVELQFEDQHGVFVPGRWLSNRFISRTGGAALGVAEAILR
jgi:hypothetical protein